MHDAGEVVDVADEVVVLGAGPGDADRVALLEGVRADEMGRNLAGDADERNGIEQRTVRPVTALVAPGPEVTSTTPTLPEERA